MNYFDDVYYVHNNQQRSYQRRIKLSTASLEAAYKRCACSVRQAAILKRQIDWNNDMSERMTQWLKDWKEGLDGVY